MDAHSSCSNLPAESAHEQRYDQPPEAAHEHEDQMEVMAAHRVRVSPAHNLLHGLWPLATSYQFLDREDEVLFKAKDFADMRPTHLIICLMEMAVPPYSLTSLGVQSRPLTWPITVCVVVQLVVRYADAHSTLGADWYGKFYFATTLIEWALVVAAQQLFGFAPIASDEIFLVLFYIFCFLQGMLAFSTIVYNTRLLLASLVIYNLVCALHLYLFVRDSESAASSGSPKQLMAPLAFGLLYGFESSITVAVAFSQLRSRRFHHAELEYMHERLKREKERMAYELAIAQKAVQSVTQSAVAYLWEGDKARRTAAQSDGDLGASGTLSVKSVGSSGEMSSHMSELARPIAKLVEEKEMLELHTAPMLGSCEMPSTHKSKERQQRLWATLSELGIRPKSANSDASELC